MNNVEAADIAVKFIRDKMQMPDDTRSLDKSDYADILMCLERLAALERHLWNLTSRGYETK